MRQIVLTAIGRDKPGIVARIAKVLYEQGGNLEDSRMAVLGGRFAVVLLANFAKEKDAAGIQHAFEHELDPLGVRVNVAESGPMEEPDENADIGVAVITVFGSDKPGIVFETASRIAACGGNVRDLSTHVIRKSSGEVYSMIIEAEFGQKSDIAELRADLEKLAEESGLDINLRALDSAVL